MGRFGAFSIVVLLGAVPALAAEMPSRKAGLWEVTMSFENRNVPGQSIQQCIDAATDQMMQSSAGPFAQQACSKRDVQRSANGDDHRFHLHDARRQDRDVASRR